MKRFIYNLALTCFLVAVSLGLLAAANRLYFENDAYLLEFPVKQQLIKDTPSPKVVILGGSNVAFGIDSKTISDSLHLPVINAGLHAGLGLRFIMDNNIPFLRKGDVLVIMPEYDHFNNADGEPLTCGMIPYFASFNELKKLNHSQLRNVMKGFGRVTLTSFVSGCKKRGVLMFLGEKKEDGIFKYRKSGFNEVGDEVSHWTLAPETNFDGNTNKKETRQIDSTFVTEFLMDVSILKQRGVKVILFPPAIYDAAFVADNEYICAVSNVLSKMGIPFQCDNKRFTYGKDEMYDTIYHLNKDGVDANTQNIIKSLEVILNTW